jgi:hypothetical protein
VARPLPVRPVVAALLATAWLGACGESSVLQGGEPPPTVVVVDPAQFLGSVPCLDAPGGMRRYVATLVDVSPLAGLDAGELTLPSSEPTSCIQAVHFSRVTPGRRYVADIDGYDRTDIRPQAPGSRIQVDTSGAYVAPRWTTSCGRLEARPDGGATDPSLPVPPEGGVPDASVPVPDAGDAATDASGDAAPTADAGASGDAAPRTDAGGAPPVPGEEAGVSPDSGVDADAGDGDLPFGLGPVTSRYLSSVIVQDCAPLVSSQSPGETAIRVILPDASASSVCGDGGAALFAVELSGSAEASRSAAPGEELTYGGLEGGKGYSFEIAGFVAGATEPSCSTACFRRAVAGVTVTAACDPLRAPGAP